MACMNAFPKEGGLLYTSRKLPTVDYANTFLYIGLWISIPSSTALLLAGASGLKQARDVAS